MNVQLLRYTLNPEYIAGLAAGLCYNAKSIERALDSALEGHHESVVEHATFTFVIEDVSRALLAQLTRHRIASFSVQSQRYVRMHDFKFVIPPRIKALGEEAEREYNEQMYTEYKWYCQWIEKLTNAGHKGEAANEDARYVLPNAACTRLMLTMNARELLHFFELRTCNRAQWEIRELADEMLKLCKKAAPVLFAGAGCGCVNGHCPEGRRSCGKPRYESEWEDSDVPRED